MHPRPRLARTAQLLALLTLTCLVNGSAQPPQAPSDGRPIARIKGNVICCPREPVQLDGWASIDVGGEIVEWQWDVTEDGITDTSAATGEMVLPAPRKSSIYSVILRVKDNQGNISDPDTVLVHVMEVAPKTYMRSDTTVKVGTRVTFKPTIHWVCAEPAKFEWDFDDDGTPEHRSTTDGATTKVYYTPGKYYANFRVIDKYGREAGLRTCVTVVERLAGTDSTATQRKM